MATLANKFVTLLDLALLPQNGQAKDVINMLSQFNPMLHDAPAMVMNRKTYHETTVLTGLPAPLWGRIYKGIPTDKATRQLIKDTAGFLEAASEIDQRLVDIYEKALDKASARMEEADAHLESMAIEMATAMFYHDTATDPEKPLGFAPRFSDLSAENGGQIIDGGGTGADNTSIWMINWSPKTCHFIFPEASQAGIKRTDRGLVPVADGNGDTYFAYREEFVWHLGLTVRDWRYVTRVANIDVSDLTVDASGVSANILDLMTEMYYKNHGRRENVGKTCIYVNTEIMKFLDYQARNVPTNLRLQFHQDGQNAKEVLHFRGIPIRESDAILSTESQVV